MRSPLPMRTPVLNFTDDKLKIFGVKIALPKKPPGDITLRFYSHMTKYEAWRFQPARTKSPRPIALLDAISGRRTRRIAMPSGVASKTMKAMAQGRASPSTAASRPATPQLQLTVEALPSFAGNTYAVTRAAARPAVAHPRAATRTPAPCPR